MHCQGKWRPSERESGGRGGEDWGDDGGHQRWEEEEVDPEDLHHGSAAGVQNGAKEDPRDAGGKDESSERARQQSGRGGGGGDDHEPPSSAIGADWDSAGLLGADSNRPPAEPPKHKTSGDHLEYMAGNLVDSLVNEPEEVRPEIYICVQLLLKFDWICRCQIPHLMLHQLLDQQCLDLRPPLLPNLL